MKKQRKKKLIAAVIVAFVSLLIFGYIKFFNGTFIYISTGFGKDGLLKTGNKKASVMDNSLSDEKRNEFNITKEKLVNMFTSFAIADTLYNDLTDNLDIEVSYDEARVITVQYICADTLEDIKKAQERLDNKEIFYVVAKDYNGEEYERECRRGELDQNFENAAYNLKSGEVSDIVESDGRYYIIKCNSDNDKSKTEANKTAILEKRKLEAFNSEFESFEAKQYVEFNNKAWNEIKLTSIGNINVKFEEVFNSHLKQ